MRKQRSRRKRVVVRQNFHSRSNFLTIPSEQSCPPDPFPNFLVLNSGDKDQNTSCTRQGLCWDHITPRDIGLAAQINEHDERSPTLPQQQPCCPHPRQFQAIFAGVSGKPVTRRAFFAVNPPSFLSLSDIQQVPQLVSSLAMRCELVACVLQPFSSLCRQKRPICAFPPPAGPQQAAACHMDGHRIRVRISDEENGWAERHMFGSVGSRHIGIIYQCQASDWA